MIQSPSSLSTGANAGISSVTEMKLTSQATKPTCSPMSEKVRCRALVFSCSTTRASVRNFQ